ncbi:MAG: N-acetylglucosamine-6-phosphate deacetylase [Chitinophagaceae bacterium]
MLKAYKADKIFTGNQWLIDHAIITRDGIIESVVSRNELDGSIEIENFADNFLAPAFIDLQIYGAHGKLLAVYPTADALFALNDYCTKGGATLFLPTVATNSIEVFHQCIDAVKVYWQQGGKGVFGLHLEGPWISKEKRGAHIEAFIHYPSIDEVKTLLAYGDGVIKMITLAPEVCSDEVIECIKSKNIIISAGHSNATYQQATTAFDNGVPTATHLYNAMSPLQHREPGMVGAIFNHVKVYSSVIPDGYHVDYGAIQIAKKIMGGRLFVITDAVTETSKGAYPHQLERDRYTANGTLSGSALTMHKAFYNLVKYVAVDVAEALRMCSLYPAQVLKCDDRYGKIAPGYTEQFVVIDNDLNLIKTIV